MYMNMYINMNMNVNVLPMKYKIQKIQNTKY